MISIYILDDHKVLAQGMQRSLESHHGIQCLGLGHSGAEGLTFLDTHKPQVILLDINLPDESGIQLLPKIHKRSPSSKCLGLSMYNSLKIVQQFMRAGGQGYLIKNAPQEELIEAIKTVIKGEQYFSADIKKALLNFNPAQKYKRAPFLPQLTRREKEILQLIVAEHTTQEIAQRLHLSLPTIETHRKNLLVKTGARNSVGLVRIALHKGLLE